MANSTVLTHDDVRCLMSLDLSDYDFLSVSKDGFVPFNVNPVDAKACGTLSGQEERYV
jgi:hypothetical protein